MSAPRWSVGGGAAAGTVARVPRSLSSVVVERRRSRRKTPASPGGLRAERLPAVDVYLPRASSAEIAGSDE